MATLISEIDCSQHTTREINQAIKRAAADGVPEVRLTQPRRPATAWPWP